MGAGTYSSTNTPIQDAIFGIDHNTPRELFEARNAVRIAHVAAADEYAASIMAKAGEQLRQAETSYRQKQNRSAIEAVAREATQTAEESRVMAVKQKAEEQAQAQATAEKRAAEERAAKARVDAEAARGRAEAEAARTQAETARSQAEAAKAEAERSKHLAVKGHTDSVGSDEYNRQLSERRAEAVRDYLVQQGISPDAIAANGLGKSEPGASNDTPEGRQQNRRVELVLSGDAIGSVTAIDSASRLPPASGSKANPGHGVGGLRRNRFPLRHGAPGAGSSSHSDVIFHGLCTAEPTSRALPSHR